MNKRNLIFILSILLSYHFSYGQADIFSEELIMKHVDNIFIAFHVDKPEVPFSGYTIDKRLDGSLSTKTFYKNGILYKTETYHKNGMTFKVINYDNRGAESGEFVEYDDQGNLVCKGKMKDGDKHGFWNFYKQGKRFEFGLYQFNLRSGTWKVDSNLTGEFKKVFYEKGKIIKDYTKKVGG